MGLSGTGRSREPGSGEVSDPGVMRGRSSRGACERGASEARDALPAAKGFLAGFTVSVPQAQASPAGLGRAKMGSCFPHLLLPSRPASRSRQCLGRGSKQSGRSCTSSSPGLSRSESRCQDGQRVGSFSAGSAFPCPAPTWKPVSPESALGEEAYCGRPARDVPGGAGRAGRAGPGAGRCEIGRAHV